jgi:hypothetical protein
MSSLRDMTWSRAAPVVLESDEISDVRRLAVREPVAAGGLMSYGTDIADVFHQVGLVGPDGVVLPECTLDDIAAFLQAHDRAQQRRLH